MQTASAADFSQAREIFQKGHYQDAIRQAQEGIKRQDYNDDWRLLLIEALMTTGQYDEALAATTNALDRFQTSIRLRLLGRDVFLYNNKPDDAGKCLEEITYLLSTRSWYYRDAPNMVALGKAALLLGVDAKKVLEQFFDRARKLDPALRDAYLAPGQLALDKDDFKLAAKTFEEGLKRFADDADFHYGLARSYAPSDARQMVRSLEKALDLNTNHVPSLLLLADHLIDGEQYDDARQQLEGVLSVNAAHPQGWAYRAVIEHLLNNGPAEAEARTNALKFWKTNPEVDYLIGRKLSQKYRFAEGAAHQRRALSFDRKFIPAKIQLAQDLLRLGEETEGWRLAKEVHDEDGYDVTAYNLATLQDTLGKFKTLTNADFIVRMGANEAPIYGEEVLALLTRAKNHLCAKYGLEPSEPTIVEIFPSQKDFAVRTFGMPGNPGFLGVCFGRVVTANSPASQGAHPANWQAVLWHEFCHVVTLQLTRNKMPRWLSEGISVYEERLANPAWGQAMTPQYREMVLGDDLTPVGELSAAFLTARSDLHLQFAYYQSSMVVEFLVERYGLESLRKILKDLAEGVEINKAIATHTAPLETIETNFTAFARQLAENLAPELEFEKPDRKLITDADELVGPGSKNFYLLMRQARKLLEGKKCAEAKRAAEQLLKAFPNYIGPDNAYVLLAEAARGLDDVAGERAVLSKLAELDADAVEAFLRLMELDANAGEWPATKTNAWRMLAVNPLVPQPHRYLAQASEMLGEAETAIRAWKTLLLLDPPDPAEAHFRLARLLHQNGDLTAKRQLLKALEEAPRFRDAHRLLLEMGSKDLPPTPPANSFE